MEDHAISRLPRYGTVGTHATAFGMVRAKNGGVEVLTESLSSHRAVMKNLASPRQRIADKPVRQRLRASESRS